MRPGGIHRAVAYVDEFSKERKRGGERESHLSQRGAITPPAANIFSTKDAKFEGQTPAEYGLDTFKLG